METSSSASAPFWKGESKIIPALSHLNESCLEKEPSLIKCIYDFGHMFRNYPATPETKISIYDVGKISGSEIVEKLGGLENMQNMTLSPRQILKAFPEYSEGREIIAFMPGFRLNRARRIISVSCEAPDTAALFYDFIFLRNKTIAVHRRASISITEHIKSIEWFGEKKFENATIILPSLST